MATLKLVLPAVLVLALVTAAVTIGGLTPISQAKPAPAGIAATCSFVDPAFCAQLSLFRGYIARRDFSDVLEHQPALALRCPDKRYAATYCRAIAAPLTLQLFTVLKSGRLTRLTRNNYIALFAAYFAAHRSLTYVTTTITSGTIQMHYATRSGHFQYTLIFTGRSHPHLLEVATATG